MPGGTWGNQAVLAHSAAEPHNLDDELARRRTLQITPVELMELLRTVFDACVQPVFVIDQRGRVSWANAAFQALVGQSGGIIPPDALLRQLPVADRDLLWNALADCNQAAMSLELELEALGNQKSEVQFSRLANSGIVGVVSARQEAPERADRMEKVLRDIAATLGDLGMGSASDDHRRRLPDDLTDRQREVVEMLFRSMSEQEIADVLFLSEHTVRNHKKAAFRRLGVHSKAELFSTYQCNVPNSQNQVIDLRNTALSS